MKVPDLILAMIDLELDHHGLWTLVDRGLPHDQVANGDVRGGANLDFIAIGGNFQGCYPAGSLSGGSATFIAAQTISRTPMQ